VIELKKMRWASHVARPGEMINAYKVPIGKPQDEGEVEVPGCRWEDNIEMHFK
jgi:hypothetical protein